MGLWCTCRSRHHARARVAQPHSAMAAGESCMDGMIPDVPFQRPADTRTIRHLKSECDFAGQGGGGRPVQQAEDGAGDAHLGGRAKLPNASRGAAAAGSCSATLRHMCSSRLDGSYSVPTLAEEGRTCETRPSAECRCTCHSQTQRQTSAATTRKATRSAAQCPPCCPGAAACRPACCCAIRVAVMKQGASTWSR